MFKSIIVGASVGAIVVNLFLIALAASFGNPFFPFVINICILLIGLIATWKTKNTSAK